MKRKIIDIKNVSFSYGNNRVLNNITLSIEEGDFVGIIGENGSAKTTLLKLMVGLLKADTGQINLFDKPIEVFKDFNKIGYISQTAREFNNMFPATVEEVVAANIYANRSFFNRLKKSDNKKVDEVLKIVEMDKFRERKIGNLSGGQKQRVFIARALVNNPSILFMDEPLVGVDFESQNRFYNLLDKLNKKYNITLVMISHDIGVISEKVNKLFCLANGKVYEHNLNNNESTKLKKIYGENMDILFHKH